MRRQPKWVESAGGPLLFASRSAVLAWHGTNGGAHSDGRTDYERACAVTHEIEVISAQGNEALVLGDEPDRTCLIRRSETEILILRWRFADSENSLLSALDRVEVDKLVPHLQGTFETTSSEYLLFDSALSAEQIMESSSVELRGGRYAFDAVNFQPCKQISALIHRLRAQD